MPERDGGGSRRRMEASMAIGLLLIIGVALLVALRFYIHRGLPRYEVPLVLGTDAIGGAGSRVLILAPHSDDETLGSGGVILKTEAAGGQVRVVLMTNGDGFRAAAEEQARTTHPGAKGFVELGLIRQRETTKAMEVLGLEPDDVIFLGYPDRGLEPMWQQYWNPGTPYASPYTGLSSSPYPQSYEPGAIYCGKGLVANLRKIIREFAPTQILVTHPSDAHPDHRATFVFLSYALGQIEAEGWGGRTPPAVYTYIVHRGDWPLPRGYHPSEPLDPPRTLASVTTRWYDYPLAPGDVQKKREAVDAYRSQTALMPFYLRSFIRTNELFGVVPEIRAAAPMTPAVAERAGVGPASLWWRVSAAILDPVDDTLARRVEAGADLRALYAMVDGGTFRLLVKPRVVPSAAVRYVFLISDFAAGQGPPGQAQPGGTPSGRTRTFYRIVTAPGAAIDIQVNGMSGGQLVDGVRDAATSGVVDGGLELDLDLASLGHPAKLLLSVESHIGDRIVDQTEWTVVALR